MLQANIKYAGMKCCSPFHHVFTELKFSSLFTFPLEFPAIKIDEL